MMDVVILVGLLFIVFSMIISYLNDSAGQDRQETYIFRGLALAFLAVGIFSIGSWLARMIFANMPDLSFAAVVTWFVGLQFIFLLLLGLAGGRRTF
jgi:hypothetical protein